MFKIYTIYWLLKDEEIIYVGRTKNLKNRLYKHKHKEYEHFGIFETCESLDLAKEREDYFINHFNPKFNRSLNKTGEYRKMSEIINELKIDDIGSFIHYLIKNKARPIFKDNYVPAKIKALYEKYTREEND